MLSHNQKLAKDCVKASPFTLPEIAAKAGVNQHTIYTWITGRSEPRSYNLKAVLESCGVDSNNIQLDKLERVRFEIESILKENECRLKFISGIGYRVYSKLPKGKR